MGQVIDRRRAQGAPRGAGAGARALSARSSSSISPARSRISRPSGSSGRSTRSPGRPASARRCSRAAWPTTPSGRGRVRARPSAAPPSCGCRSCGPSASRARCRPRCASPRLRRRGGARRGVRAGRDAARVLRRLRPRRPRDPRRGGGGRGHRRSTTACAPRATSPATARWPATAALLAAGADRLPALRVGRALFWGEQRVRGARGGVGARRRPRRCAGGPRRPLRARRAREDLRVERVDRLGRSSSSGPSRARPSASSDSLSSRSRSAKGVWLPGMTVIWRSSMARTLERRPAMAHGLREVAPPDRGVCSAAMTTETTAVHGGRLVARRLKAHGVTKLFTLSGGPPLLDLRRLPRGGHRPRRRAPRVGRRVRRRGLGEGHARTPGVCALTAGPGVTNGMSALGSAQQNHSPMLVLGGRAPAMRWGQGSLQEIDHVPFVRPLRQARRDRRLDRRDPGADRRGLGRGAAPALRPGVRRLPARPRVHGGAEEDAGERCPRAGRAPTAPSSRARSRCCATPSGR